MENFRDSVANPIEGFEETIERLNQSGNVSGILDYLLTLKEEIVRLPTSHKNTPITIQRIILLILPLLKLLDEKTGKDLQKKTKLQNQIHELCETVENSEYALPIKVNS